MVIKRRIVETFTNFIARLHYIQFKMRTQIVYSDVRLKFLKKLWNQELEKYREYLIRSKLPKDKATLKLYNDYSDFHVQKLLKMYIFRCNMKNSLCYL